MNVYSKYLKYKNKYVDFKNNLNFSQYIRQSGGSVGGVTSSKSIPELVLEIHKKNATLTGNKFVITTAGGGYSGGYFVMSQFGASSTVLELNGPYARESSLEFLKEPALDKFADFAAANKFAIASLKRSRDLITMTKKEIKDLETLDYCYGVGIASSLVSKDYKKGFHQCNIVLLSNRTKFTIQIQFKKNLQSEPHFRSRTEEDNICGNILVIAMALVCGIINKNEFDNLIQSKSDLKLEESQKESSENHLKYGEITGSREDSSNSDRFIFNIVKVNEPIHRLLTEDDNEKVNSVLCIQKNEGFKYIINPPLESLGKYLEFGKSNIIMLPGSFNPLHQGHINLLEEAATKSKSQGLYELAVINVDKPPLKIDEIMRRLEIFASTKEPIIITNTPRYIDKAKLFPGVSYVIGVDTAIRIVDPIYTEGNKFKMIESIYEIVRNGTRFYVIPRNFDSANIPGKYGLVKKPNGLVTLEDDIIHFIPDLFKEYFISLPNNPDSSNISSSQLRA